MTFKSARKHSAKAKNSIKNGKEDLQAARRLMTEKEKKELKKLKKKVGKLKKKEKKLKKI